MKKVSRRQHVWFTRHQRRQAFRKLSQKRRQALKKNGIKLRKATLYVGNQRTRRAWVSANGDPMPSNFCLDQNFDETAYFLEQLRQKMLSRYIEYKNKFNVRPKPIQDWFDIGTIDRITPSAALIMAAEFDRFRRLSKKSLFAINVKSWKTSVITALNQLGLFSILEIDGSNSLFETKDGELIILPFRTGDKTIGSEAHELIQELATVVIESSGMPDLTRDDEIQGGKIDRTLDLYHILLEAMNNVIEHAYRTVGGIDPSPIKRWWMTAAVNRSNKTLTVAIYDQGVSVPVSLPNWYQYDKAERYLRKLFSRPPDSNDTSQDGAAIAIAMRVAVSGTNASYRGKGFGRMKQFVDGCQAGRLRVISRHGEYVYEKGMRAKYHNNASSIGGTLVEWKVSF